LQRAKHCFPASQTEVFAMAVNRQFPETDPRHHTTNIKGMLENVVTHLREDVGKVDEPRAQALFETSAEVLIGLVTALEHYEEASEPAFQR
jgi:hypothetical protein